MGVVRETGVGQSDREAVGRVMGVPEVVTGGRQSWVKVLGGTRAE